MNMMRKKLGWFLALIFIVPIFFMLFRRNNLGTREVSSSNTQIVSSCFPVYNIVKEVLLGLNEFKITNLTSNYLGDHSCLHDYALTTDNARAIESASVVVVNGVDFEPFIYKNTEDKIIIDSSKNVSVNEEKNPYIWISINNYLRQIESISDELSTIYPKYKEKILNNSKVYSKKLIDVKNKWDNKFEDSKGVKVASFSEKFNYLFNDLGLATVNLLSSHSHESEISADVISNAVNKIKENDFKFFFSTKDNSKVNESIEKESGAKCIVLRSLDNPSDGSYVNQMESNLEKIYESLNS